MRFFMNRMTTMEMLVRSLLFPIFILKDIHLSIIEI